MRYLHFRGRWMAWSPLNPEVVPDWSLEAQVRIPWYARHHSTHSSTIPLQQWGCPYHWNHPLLCAISSQSSKDRIYLRVCVCHKALERCFITITDVVRLVLQPVHSLEWTMALWPHDLLLFPRRNIWHWDQNLYGICFVNKMLFSLCKSIIPEDSKSFRRYL